MSVASTIIDDIAEGVEMAWARIDDGFDDHPKVMDLDLAAVGLWTLCLTWAHRNTRKRGATPGAVPASLPRRFSRENGEELAMALVMANLWHRPGHECERCPEITDGWVIHDFAIYLPRDETREARSQAGKKGAAKRWAGKTKATQKQTDSKLPSASHDVDSNALANDGSRAPARRAISNEIAPTPTVTSDEVTPTPVPEKISPPDPPKGGEPRTSKSKPATTVPGDFTITSDMRAWVAENAPLADIDRETAQFLDHHAAKGSTFKDWTRAWHTWMRNEQRYAEQRHRSPPGVRASPRRSTTDERVRAGWELADRYEREDES